MDNILLTAKAAPEKSPQISDGADNTWQIITCEYPPQTGGVSDYTYLVAKELARWKDDVHIWCPKAAGERPGIAGVTIHPAGRFSPADLRALGRQLDTFPKPRRVLVQWVPHGFGYKSVNLFFCMWLWYRSARHRDAIELMVHEPFLPFRRGKWRQNAAAVVQRLMTIILLRAAERIFMSTPSWESRLRPFESGGHRVFKWLPITSNVPYIEDPEAVFEIRQRYRKTGLLAGHFGTFGAPIAEMLEAIVPRLLTNNRSLSLLLLGGGGQEFRERLVKKYPELRDVLHATGHVHELHRLSLHLSACDLMIQPYPEGVTTRRGTAMAALSHGRPLVTTSGVLTEPVWEASQAVALTPAGDIEGFVDATLRVSNDPAYRGSLAKLARELYERQFDIRKTVATLRSRR